MIVQNLSSLLILLFLFVDHVLVNSFPPSILHRNRPFPAPSTSKLLSTTESDSVAKTSSDDDSNNDEELTKGLEKFAEDFVDIEVVTSNAEDQAPPSTAELDTDMADEDFVLVGGKSTMEKDELLKMVSSELSIWKNLRKDPLKTQTGLPLSIILQRTWDTVEDVWAHVRRIPFEKGWVELSDEAEVTRKTVVVLGSGWAAHALMKVSDCQKLRLIVISPSNHFVSGEDTCIHRSCAAPSYHMFIVPFLNLSHSNTHTHISFSNTCFFRFSPLCWHPLPLEQSNIAA